jgi:hypothetical protein
MPAAARLNRGTVENNIKMHLNEIMFESIDRTHVGSAVGNRAVGSFLTVRVMFSLSTSAVSTVGLQTRGILAAAP